MWTYYHLRTHIYWPYITVIASFVLESCTLCACQCIKLQKHVTEQKLLPAPSWLAYVSISIPGPLNDLVRDSAVKLTMKDRFLNLTKNRIFLHNNSAQHCQNLQETLAVFLWSSQKAFYRQWRKTYIPCLTNVYHSASALIHRMTTYHLQTNGRPKLFYRTHLVVIFNQLLCHLHTKVDFSNTPA